jgi:hypothetical protein
VDVSSELRDDGVSDFRLIALCIPDARLCERSGIQSKATDPAYDSGFPVGPEGSRFFRQTQEMTPP